VLYDQLGRVYPAEYFEVPADRQPPAVDGTGATHIEAYRAVCGQFASLQPGHLPPT
jgi:hypothetical protein